MAMASMDMDPSEAPNWKYRGEGAANVVLFYDGKNPDLIGKVLRIRKLFHAQVADPPPPSSSENGSHNSTSEAIAVNANEAVKQENSVKSSSPDELNNSKELESVPPVAGLESEVTEGFVSGVEKTVVEINTQSVETFSSHLHPTQPVDSGNTTYSIQKREEFHSTAVSLSVSNDISIQNESENSPDVPLSSNSAINLSQQTFPTLTLPVDNRNSSTSVVLESKSSLEYQRTDSIDSRHPVLSFEEQVLWSDHPEIGQAKSSADLMFYYAESIMKPIIGADFVDPGKIVHINQHFLEIFSKNIDEKRPKFRKENKNFEIAKGKALLISDHSFLPHVDDAFQGNTICVEIKPKCGFITQCRSISPRNKIKTKKSRFSLLQYLKLVKGQVNEISHYNPLFLFSEVFEEVLLSLLQLFLSPQNNFRLFFDSVEIFGQKSDKHLKQTEVQLIQKEDQNHEDLWRKTILELQKSEGDRIFIKQILGQIREKFGHEKYDDLENSLNQFFGGFRFESQEELLLLFSRLVSKIILESKIMHRLLKVQQLDCYDIEGMVHVYEKYQKFLNDGSEDLEFKEFFLNNSVDKNGNEIFSWRETGTSFKIQKDECSVEQVDSEILMDEEEKNWRLEIEKIKSLSMEECKQLLRNFLISTTAKDLGIMISLQRISSAVNPKRLQTFLESFPNIQMCEFGSLQFIYKISFVDLDMKPLKKIPKYLKIDRDILKNYIQFTIPSKIQPSP